MDRTVRQIKANLAGCAGLILLLAGVASAQNVAGTLDPCFSSTPSGASTVPGMWIQQPQVLPPSYALKDFYSSSVVVLPDRRIVQVGTVLDPDQSDNFAVAVVHDGCELDPTPATQVLEIPFEPAYGPNSTSYDWATGAAVAPDGGIIVVGRSAPAASGNSFDPDGLTTFAITRVIPGDKTFLPYVDPDFGFNGLVLTSFGPGSNSAAAAVTIDSSGRIVVVGNSDLGFAIARYLPSGALDPSFGNSGEVEFSFDDVTDNLGFTFGRSGGGSSAEATGVAIDEEGRIILVGEAGDRPAINNELINHQPLKGSEEFAIARLNDDGSLDSTFGSGGKILTSFTQSLSAISTDYASGVALDPLTGAIVVGGSTLASAACGFDEYGNIAACPNGFNGAGYTFALASYGTDGTLLSKVVSSVVGSSYGLAVDASRRVVMAGKTCCIAYEGGGYSSIAVARFVNSAGALDFTFGNLGVATQNLGLANGRGPSDERVDSSNGGGDMLALDSLGRIIVAGSTQYLAPGVQVYQFALERYISENEDLSASAAISPEDNTILVGQSGQASEIQVGLSIESKELDGGPADVEILLPTGFFSDGATLDEGSTYQAKCGPGPFLISQEEICTLNGVSILPQNFTLNIGVLDTVPLGGATVNYKVIGNDPNITDNSGSFTLYVKSPQTISLDPIPNHTWSDADFTINAPATSGLPVTFQATGPCTTTVSVPATSVVTMTAAGYCTITASQVGNDQYLAAPDVTQKFAIAPLDVTKDFTITRKGFVPNLATHTYTQTVALTNNSSETIAAPVSLVLDGLAGTLLNASGSTSSLAPPLSPYINDGADISPGQTVVFSLQLSSTNNSYSVRALSGPGAR